ncbi:MAG TPA: putative metal-dependent hydrolase [Ignavibacteriaceae bacterium]|nr:putative metal-dependent hydrolase [Ignavibacteriaceae bacterium]
MNSKEHLRYPLGRFKVPKQYTTELRDSLINELEEAPFHLRDAVENLNDEQLNTPYREGGWTVEQVIHHLPDSHMNAYIRVKLALTEDEPTIKPYNQDDWARLVDYMTTPIETSLKLFEAIHLRWVIILRSLTPEQFQRKLRHPEVGLIDIDWCVAQYAWHGKHHTAQINSLKQRMGW